MGHENFRVTDNMGKRCGREVSDVMKENGVMSELLPWRADSKC